MAELTDKLSVAVYGACAKLEQDVMKESRRIGYEFTATPDVNRLAKGEPRIYINPNYVGDRAETQELRGIFLRLFDKNVEEAGYTIKIIVQYDVGLSSRANQNAEKVPKSA
ncbi:MAG: hypothetical protein ACP5N3_05480 [Candidatus Nanoarchaeia archaeon]